MPKARRCYALPALSLVIPCTIGEDGVCVLKAVLPDVISGSSDPQTTRWQAARRGPVLSHGQRVQPRHNRYDQPLSKNNVYVSHGLYRYRSYTTRPSSAYA